MFDYKQILTKVHLIEELHNNDQLSDFRESFELEFNAENNKFKKERKERKERKEKIEKIEKKEKKRKKR